MGTTLLRAFLALGAITWGAAAPGVFLSWSFAAGTMESLGAAPIPYDRMLEYWLRMASGAFALVGCIYLLLLLWPQRFREIIPWMGAFGLCEGVILLVYGLRLGLSPWPFYGDVAACFVSGAGILTCWPAARVRLHPEGVEALPPPNREDPPGSWGP